MNNTQTTNNPYVDLNAITVGARLVGAFLCLPTAMMPESAINNALKAQWLRSDQSWYCDAIAPHKVS